MSVHSQNDDIILQFGLRKPAFRICVNTPTTHGSIGLTTGLDPAMTLGCGGWGGNITSDNISPKHLLNIKRLAYEVRPAVVTAPTVAPTVGRAVSGSPTGTGTTPLPKAPAARVGTGISAEALADRIDQFLASRGYRPAGSAGDAASPSPDARRDPQSPGTAHESPTSNLPHAPVTDPADTPAAFVCEDDVRQAIRAGRKVVVGERTIITPAARDLGEAQKVFVQAGWPR